MAYTIIVGLTTEGTSDIRFLETIVEQAFEIVAQECLKDVDIITLILETTKVGKGTFADYVVEAAKEALQSGVTTVAVHSDADRNTYEKRMEFNFIPAQEALDKLSESDVCKLITPVIPVHMIEAWMLADKNLLKSEIGTNLSDSDLDIDGSPESMADPKSRIDTAIRIANEHSSHKSPVKNVDISDLYEILGQKLQPEQLMRMESYNRFLNEIRNVYKKLGILH